MDDAQLARIRAHVARIDELDALLHHGVARSRSDMHNWAQTAKAEVMSRAERDIAQAQDGLRRLQQDSAAHAVQQSHELAHGDAIREFSDEGFGQLDDVGIRPAYRFGHVAHVGPAGELAPTAIPAVIPLITEGHTTIVHQTPHGREVARATVASLLTRLLATVPPGQLLIHLIDPVGLGEGIAPFMRALDEAPWLVQDGVVVEPREIAERMTRLRDRIVTIQTQYLSGQHATMRAFHEHAGDIVEPTVLVVLLDVPEGLSGGAASDLRMLLRSGPATSLHILSTVDGTAAMPAGLPLSDLYATSNVLRARPDGTIRWRPWGPNISTEAKALPELTIIPDAAPPANLTGAITASAAAQAATASGKVSPLVDLIPPQDQWWQETSLGGLSVPVGSMGTRPQELMLGDDPVHALVIGKTGSGKSTLLHSWVLSLTTALSPDELELYLVDMKEGVEFKRYGRSGDAFLPHARVVAMESDREFALAVLQQLKDEIKARGKLQRKAGEGINHIDKLREVTGKPLPRIVCIIDEFQKLFEADDRLGTRAASLLEQVSREGRAFGVHLIMASQSLRSLGALVGGQRSATFGQFGLRVALKAGSPEDSELVLGDPSAARLERRGLAIINDRGGAKGAARRMQVAYANDDEQHQIIHALHQKALARGPLRTPVVFEGSAPARLDEHEDLAVDNVDVPTIFLGPAVAFAPPAAIELQPEPGRHVTIVGQGTFDEETEFPLYLTMLANSILSLAMTAPQGSRFVFLNCLSSRRQDDPAQAFNLPAQLAGALAGHHVDVATTAAQRASALTTVAELLDNRTTADQPIFLIGMDLHRDEALHNDPMARRRGNEGPDPAAALQELLKSGPDASVHLISGFASVDQVKTAVGRDGLKHLGLRVIANALPAEVSDFIPVWSPSARIGQRRAVVWDAEQADAYLKFIPWQHPHDRNVSRVASRAPDALASTMPLSSLAPTVQTADETQDNDTAATPAVRSTDAPRPSAHGGSNELDSIRERLEARRQARAGGADADSTASDVPPTAEGGSDSDPDGELAAIRERLAARREARRRAREGEDALARPVDPAPAPPSPPSVDDVSDRDGGDDEDASGGWGHV